jgi:anti-sigma factor RsiW
MTNHFPHHLPDEVLHEFIDAALAPGRRAEVDAHLAECEACAARLARLRALFARIASVPDVPLARDLAPPVMARLLHKPNGTTGLPGLRWAMGLQLIVALTLLAVAWPSLRQHVDAPAAAPLVVQAVEALGAVRLALADAWAAWSTSFSALAAHSLDAVRYLPALPLASFAWAPLVVAASLLWLVGNGLLVYPTIARRPAQGRRRE